MEEIKTLWVYDLPDTKSIPDGYDMQTVPDISAENILILMEKINEIVGTVNELINKTPD